MRVPLSWLRELAEIPGATVGIARAMTDAGLQVERIDDPSAAIDGPVVVGHVLDFVDEPQKNGKVIRWCHVDVGRYNPEGEPGRGIVCGAHNFDVGDYVAVALAGTTLPGGFFIAARKTYGHISDGMICAEDELGLGIDHEGIMILASQPAPQPGSDALVLLGAREAVFDIDVTPDMGYCLSVRGLAREAAQITGGRFADPYATPVPANSGRGYPVRLETPNCALFTAIKVTGIDPSAPTPPWMVARLRAAGMRPIFLGVDIANYVMLESGQPLHTYALASLRGAIVVRQAKPGEKITTLDKVERSLSGEDMLITDDSGPIGLAGVMGGLTTELQRDTTDILIEAAWFDPATIGRTYRRHKLPSEASRRFERGVDQGVAYAAGRRCAELLRDLAGGVISDDATIAGAVQTMPAQTIAAQLPARLLGFDVPASKVVEVLRASGVAVEELPNARLALTPPTWRRDLVDPYDYVEEVGQKVGYSAIPSRVPTAPAGRGYTPRQQAQWAIVQGLAGAGLGETLTLPFIGAADLDKLGLAANDERRRVVALANPLSDAQPWLRTTLLPGLLAAVNRNTSRSLDDVRLFEAGSVFLETGAGPQVMPDVSHRPDEAEIGELFARLPRQPIHIAAVLTGDWLSARPDGPAQPVTWANAVAAAQAVAQAVGVTLERRSAAVAPWHPGRCAELGVTVRGEFVTLGHAGELHPGVVGAWGLPSGTCAMELDADALVSVVDALVPGEITSLSSHPAVKQDVALVVDAGVPSAAVEAALRAGAGELLESIRLFDVFQGAQLGAGKKSLAYSLVFRAPDRTLTEAEASQAREAAVDKASEL
ncbi:MAG: phenylalanine--tRNA ligase subunit beta, partial [Propionibacteriaceae bacterium]|nr:phenylalanine--tRNA ligase subunit beta [Propionibacteriaceae bacterium]